MMGFWFFITKYLQGVSGYSPIEAGLAFLPMTVVNFAVAVAVPRLTHKFTNARLLAAGLALTLIGMAWLSRLSADTSYITGIALPMILIGAGQGATLSRSPLFRRQAPHRPKRRPFSNDPPTKRNPRRRSHEDHQEPGASTSPTRNTTPRPRRRLRSLGQSGSGRGAARCGFGAIQSQVLDVPTAWSISSATWAS
jgi:hypothetical protein